MLGSWAVTAWSHYIFTLQVASGKLSSCDCCRWVQSQCNHTCRPTAHSARQGCKLSMQAAIGLECWPQQWNQRQQWVGPDKQQLSSFAWWPNGQWSRLQSCLAKCKCYWISVSVAWCHILHRRYATGLDISTLEADGHIASAASMHGRLCMVHIIMNKSWLNQSCHAYTWQPCQCMLALKWTHRCAIIFWLLTQVAQFLMYMCL